MENSSGDPEKIALTHRLLDTRIAIQLDELIQQWVSFGGDGLTDEERSVFYKALSHISENLQQKLDSQIYTKNT